MSIWPVVTLNLKMPLCVILVPGRGPDPSERATDDHRVAAGVDGVDPAVHHPWLFGKGNRSGNRCSDWRRPGSDPHRHCRRSSALGPPS